MNLTDIRPEQFTSIGRALEPRYPTNLAIMILTVVAGGIAGIVALANGYGFAEAATAGFWSGVATLFAWIIGREVDPDNNYAAFVAAVLAFVAAFFVTAAPALLALLLVVQLVRVVNRTVGPPAKLTDTLVIVSLVVLALLSSLWPLALVAAVAFYLDSRLPEPNRRHLGAAMFVLALLAVYFLIGDVVEPGVLSVVTVVITLGMSALWIATMDSMNAVESRSDVGNTPLDLQRVQAGMGVVLLTGLLLLWQGDAGISAMAPLWAAIVGVAIYRLVKRAILGWT